MSVNGYIMEYVNSDDGLFFCAKKAVFNTDAQISVTLK